MPPDVLIEKIITLVMCIPAKNTQPESNHEETICQTGEEAYREPQNRSMCLSHFPAIFFQNMSYSKQNLGHTYHHVVYPS